MMIAVCDRATAGMNFCSSKTELPEGSRDLVAPLVGGGVGERYAIARGRPCLGMRVWGCVTTIANRRTLNAAVCDGSIWA